MSRTRTQRFGGEFADDPDAAWTLSAPYYTDPEVYRREQARIFMRNWSYVCHRSQLAAPGDYVACTIAGIGVVVLRDREGELRAFHNVCRHRGHELLTGSGRLAATITCPYHAWAYGLDGALRQAPNGDRVAGFDRAGFSLVPVRVEEFCTFVFVNPDLEAASLAAQAPEVEPELRRWLPELDDLVFSRRLEVPVAANWKAVADNFLECYHCDHVHKALVEEVNDMTTYEVTLGGVWSSHISRGTHGGVADRGFVGYFLWPNTTLGAYPGPPNMINHVFRADGPGRCVQIFDFLFAQPEPTGEDEKLIAYIRDVLAPEDNTLVEGVQRGLQSPAYLQGRLMIDANRSHLSEHAVHHFQGLVLAALEGDG